MMGAFLPLQMKPEEKITFLFISVIKDSVSSDSAISSGQTCLSKVLC